MRRSWVFAAAAGMAAAWGGAGCQSNDAPPSPNVNLFGPTSMRIHPIFTQPVAHNGNIDAVEAQLEFDDQFGDPTKASGKVLFELFSLRKDYPDPRGERAAGPWVGSLQTLAEQYARWNTTLRTYKFELNDPRYQTDQSYVLTAVFEKTGGGRFFDRIVLPAAPAKPHSRHQNSARAGLLDSLGPTPSKPASPSTAPSAGEANHEHARPPATRPALPATQPLEFSAPDPAAP